MEKKTSKPATREVMKSLRSSDNLHYQDYRVSKKQCKMAADVFWEVYKNTNRKVD